MSQLRHGDSRPPRRGHRGAAQDLQAHPGHPAQADAGPPHQGRAGGAHSIYLYLYSLSTLSLFLRDIFIRDCFEISEKLRDRIISCSSETNKGQLDVIFNATGDLTKYMFCAKKM